eukprot:3941929-Rhodomonas_salina.3
MWGMLQPDCYAMCGTDVMRCVLTWGMLLGDGVGYAATRLLCDVRVCCYQGGGELAPDFNETHHEKASLVLENPRHRKRKKRGGSALLCDVRYRRRVCCYQWVEGILLPDCCVMSGTDVGYLLPGEEYDHVGRQGDDRRGALPCYPAARQCPVLRGNVQY